MRKFVITFLLLVLIGSAQAGNNSDDNWILISSNETFWIKTVNNNQHELLVAYHDNEPQFLLILKTDSPPPDKTLAVSIRIDRGEKQPAKLYFLERRPEQIIFRLDPGVEEKNVYLSQMIAGLKVAIDFDFASKSTATNKLTAKTTSFSLIGFTVAFNDLLLANEIGSLDPAWLLRHNKDRELYCLMTTDISIAVMEYRLSGKSYKNILHLIPKTGYSIIDHNLGEIIEQVYKIPQKNLSYVPRAEKYLMFSNCMKQPFQ